MTTASQHILPCCRRGIESLRKTLWTQHCCQVWKQPTICKYVTSWIGRLWYQKPNEESYIRRWLPPITFLLVFESYTHSLCLSAVLIAETCSPILSSSRGARVDPNYTTAKKLGIVFFIFSMDLPIFAATTAVLSWKYMAFRAAQLLRSSAVRKCELDRLHCKKRSAISRPQPGCH
jgi:hypothetical protein